MPHYNPSKDLTVSKNLAHWDTRDLLEMTASMQQRMFEMEKYNKPRIVGKAIPPCCAKIPALVLESA